MANANELIEMKKNMETMMKKITELENNKMIELQPQVLTNPNNDNSLHNTINNNSITQNIQQNIVQQVVINPFGKEQVDITNKQLVKMLRKCYNSIPELINYHYVVHFNKDMHCAAENSNVTT